MYIPQYTDKTASLNVAIAGSIIFHHFGLWAGYEEEQRTGYKFGDGQENRGKGDYVSKVTYIDFKEGTDQPECISTDQVDLIR